MQARCTMNLQCHQMCSKVQLEKPQIPVLRCKSLPSQDAKEFRQLEFLSAPSQMGTSFPEQQW